MIFFRQETQAYSYYISKHFDAIPDENPTDFCYCYALYELKQIITDYQSSRFLEKNLAKVTLRKMAARRLVKSSVDWIAFAERVPENQREFFKLFKTKCDGFLHKLVYMPLYYVYFI